MSQPPLPTVITPSGAEGSVDGRLAGSDALGSGYDPFDEYGRATSLRHRLVDLGGDQRVTLATPGTDEPQPATTRQLIRVVQVNEGDAGLCEGSTLSEFSSTFAAAVSLKGAYGYFKGEMDAAFDRSQSTMTRSHFVEVTQKAYYYKLELPTPAALRDAHLSPAARDDLAHMAPAELVRQYGTHYLATLLVGGRCTYSCRVDTARFESEIGIAAAAKLSLRSMLGGAETKMSAKETQAVESLQSSSRSRARVFGGDPRLAHAILHGGYEAWLESLPRNMVFCALGRDSLVPISELISETSRKREVEAAIDDAKRAHPLPDDPSIVPVHRLHADSPSRWYFTTDPDPRRAPRGLGAIPGLPFDVFDKPAAGTAPVYRLSAASGPSRFMLSMDPTSRHGWGEATVAFHAYPGDGAGRQAVRGFTCNATSATSGWYYTTEDRVNSWTCKEPATFFVPHAG